MLFLVVSDVSEGERCHDGPDQAEGRPTHHDPAGVLAEDVRGNLQRGSVFFAQMQAKSFYHHHINRQNAGTSI